PEGWHRPGSGNRACFRQEPRADLVVRSFLVSRSFGHVSQGRSVTLCEALVLINRVSLDLLDQLVQRDRLGLEIDAADLDAFAAVTFECVRGESDDRDMLGLRVLADDGR